MADNSKIQYVYISRDTICSCIPVRSISQPGLFEDVLLISFGV